VRNRLIDAAMQEAGRLGFGFSQDCRSDLEGWIDQAVATMRMDGTLGDDSQVDMAETHLKIAVRAMVQEAVKGGATELQEWTLGNVKSWICPLWPFCT
jgi:hypothetical protein